MSRARLPDYSVSVIVPARDEAGTIERVAKSIPKMGKSVEIIYVEGFSTDGTWEAIGRVIDNYRGPHKLVRVKQSKVKGKRVAVELGFAKAKGDIIMILDSDLTVRPSELPRFYKVLATHQAQFANGSRFVYPKEQGAMHYLNHTGNIFFSWIFSLILRERITDTLCGTKAFFKSDYNLILQATKHFRQDDPYGDFTFFLGASLLGLTIVEVPVPYYARVYGKTKISRFKDGLKLLQVLVKFMRPMIFSHA